ncbi:MAG: DUF3459 domain-containing protein [Saprospiraceae bacterium]|nr:DUF3459 domain-containing protein [Saprospiraceae bacterium]
MSFKLIAALFFLLVLLAVAGKAQSAGSTAPQWAADAIWYQIFVERFANGDPSNDPRPADIQASSDFFALPKDWALTPWTQDWYRQEPWAAATGRPLNETLFFRRYGGDLQGVLNKLDYLQELGITAIYFNPLNDAPSSHKYDARSYHHIDVTFGPDPEGDKKIMAAENPTDPATWQWTSADRLFLRLVQEAHQRNIRVVVDYSWNHTGTEFWAWKDILQHQQKSKYKDWYEILSFDDPATPGSEFRYRGWANVSSLPEIKKVDVPVPRQSGHPYEGNIHPDFKKHIFDVTRRWLAPNGDPKQGIDGYRLDVADQIPLGFWRELRRVVKSTKPDAYLVGEIWWEQWPDRLMNPVPYCRGDMFDAVMFYQAYRPARSFFAQPEDAIDARQFADSLLFQWNRLGKSFRYAMMNTAATHDAPRLLTCFYNTGKYKYRAQPYENPAYQTGKPDADAYRRVRLYLLHTFTSVGAPHIWNGDELGMWGGDDPDCRKPLWWREYRMDPETRNNVQPGAKTTDLAETNDEHFKYYQQLTRLRHAHPVLRQGKCEFLLAEGRRLMYRRYDRKAEIFVLFNLETEPRTFHVPRKGKFRDVLSGATHGADVELAPGTGLVLERIR